MSLDPTVIIGTVHFNHSNTTLQRLRPPLIKEQPSPTWRRGMFRLSDDEFIFHDSSSKRNSHAKRVVLPHAPPLTSSQIDTPPLQTDSDSESQDISLDSLNHTPIPLPCTSVPSNIPNHIQFTHDRLLKSIGFLSNPKLHKAIPMAAKPNISIQHFDRNPTLNPGEIASLRAADRNKNPSPLPERPGDLYHCDIGFGPTRAIGGALYCLTLVDAKTRHTFIYPLKNLTSDLVNQFKQFITDVEGMCNEIRTDFDQKIIGGKVKDYLLNEHIKISAAPPRQQHKNGLVERKYQTILKMTRNWLISSLLPSNYWWFAMKRAVEVSNMLPTLSH